LSFVEAMPLLLRVIEDPESRSVENVSPTENAIAAVTKILKHCSVPTTAEVLARWMSWLPVWEDNEEAVHVYGYLCDLVEK
jgi:importin-5